MIKSMTGFGGATTEVDGATYTVEIKTVNHRHFKLHMKTPEAVSCLTDQIEKLLRQKIQRGSANFSLRIHNAPGLPSFKIDEDIIAACISRLKDVAAATGIDEKIDITNLLALPGIVQPLNNNNNHAEEIKAAITELTRQALKQLDAMRTEEGRSLAEDLGKNCSDIQQSLSIISERSPLVVKQYHERLNKRAAELLAESRVDIDTDILARETAIFAERTDIAEEVNRLTSHLTQFAQCCKSDKPAGRRLDFICQEMLRETNTIASKACDAGIGACVIDIKCAIDRIKEQVQNAE